MGFLEDSSELDAAEQSVLSCEGMTGQQEHLFLSGILMGLMHQFMADTGTSVEPDLHNGDYTSTATITTPPGRKYRLQLVPLEEDQDLE